MAFTSRSFTSTRRRLTVSSLSCHVILEQRQGASSTSAPQRASQKQQPEFALCNQSIILHQCRCNIQQNCAMLCCSAGRAALTQSQCPCTARTAITSRLLCLFATAVVLLSVAEGHVYFGYYSANNSATPWATIYQAATIADAQSSWDLHKIPSLLSVYDVFLTSTATSPLVLRPDFGARWSAFADAAQPLLSKGVLLGFNLGDELVRAARCAPWTPPDTASDVELPVCLELVINVGCGTHALPPWQLYRVVQRSCFLWPIRTVAQQLRARGSASAAVLLQACCCNAMRQVKVSIPSSLDWFRCLRVFQTLRYAFFHTYLRSRRTSALISTTWTGSYPAG